MKPVSKTAYYCCGVRMADASSVSPLINDTYAKLLMGDEGLSLWEAFKKHPNPNGTNVARCFILDTWIRESIRSNPNTSIILIGAGLDSRAYRIAGGNWIELDEPGIIEYKERLLPAHQSKNPLQRISIDFEKEELHGKLAAFANLDPVVIVVEGVLMYLSQEQRKVLFTTLTGLFKHHTLLCDLMNAKFFEKLGRRGIYVELEKLNALFKDIMKNPEQLLLDAGYTLAEVKSNVITASDHHLLTIPRFLVKFLMKKLFMGYSTYRFRYGLN